MKGVGGRREMCERKFMGSAVRVPGVSTEYGIIPGGVVGRRWRSPWAIVREWTRGAIRRLV